MSILELECPQRHQEKKSPSSEFSCPDCGSELVESLWPIFICMECHQRRNSEQARTGQKILGDIQVTTYGGDYEATV